MKAIFQSSGQYDKSDKADNTSERLILQSMNLSLIITVVSQVSPGYLISAGEGVQDQHNNKWTAKHPARKILRLDVDTGSPYGIHRITRLSESMDDEIYAGDSVTLGNSPLIPSIG
jgi:hypothetical protein